MLIHVDHVYVIFDDEGHRSKFKVTGRQVPMWMQSVDRKSESEVGKTRHGTVNIKIPELEEYVSAFLIGVFVDLDLDLWVFASFMASLPALRLGFCFSLYSWCFFGYYKFGCRYQCNCLVYTWEDIVTVLYCFVCTVCAYVWALLTGDCWLRCRFCEFCVLCGLLACVRVDFVCFFAYFVCFWLLWVWLPVPLQSTAWKDSSPNLKWHVTCWMQH